MDGLTRIDILAIALCSNAILLIVSNSSNDSTLKHIIFFSKANLISSSVLPTPEKTVFEGSPPASITLNNSPAETISNPELSFARRESIERLELAFTE